jgi:hypothetical protein
MDGARYLEDGKLTIFKRSGVYYARIRLLASGRYIWRSLKTTDEQTAIRAGRRLLFHLEQRVDQGLPPKSKLFSAVIDDYIRYRERDHRHGKTSAGILSPTVKNQTEDSQISTSSERWPQNDAYFYAVMAFRNGVGGFEVARNMGTSVQVIQQYYGKQATFAPVRN